MSRKWIANVRDWYVGEYRWYDNDPYFRRLYIGGWYERHWTSRAAHAVVEGLTSSPWLTTAVLAAAVLTATFHRVG